MELLTVRETAQMLKVTPMTVRRYIAAGRLAAVKVGKGVRVRKETIAELVQPIVPRQDEPRVPVPRGRPTSADDPLWNIIGIAQGPDDRTTDVSENKHRYLAEAYAAEAQ